MSRIPAAEWLPLAEPIRSIESFSDKVALASQSMPKPMATLTALQYEAVAVIGRLTVLIERGANPVLMEKASIAISRWNQAVATAGGLVNQ